MSGLRCAVGLPNVGEYGDPRLLVELACRAESSGWDGVFIWDHVAYRELGWPVADPYTSIAAIAARTSRVRVGEMIAALRAGARGNFPTTACTTALLRACSCPCRSSGQAPDLDRRPMACTAVVPPHRSL
jgi:Luciferase-like monooxygenase